MLYLYIYNIYIILYYWIISKVDKYTQYIQLYPHKLSSSEEISPKALTLSQRGHTKSLEVSLLTYKEYLLLFIMLF